MKSEERSLEDVICDHLDQAKTIIHQAGGRIDQEALDEMVFDAASENAASLMNQGESDEALDDADEISSRINNMGAVSQVAALLAMGLKPAEISEGVRPEVADSGPEGRYVIADHEASPGGGWTHLFEEEGEVREMPVRFVYDVDDQKLVSADIQRSGKWHSASASEIDDLEDSLKNANDHAMSNPADYGLQSSDDLPEWARSNDLEM